MQDRAVRRPSTRSRRVANGREEQLSYVLKTVEERAVRFIQLWFTDVLGTPKSFSITPAELERALEEGMTFDGSAIDGFSRVQESDVLAKPDATTFQVLPWREDGTTVARVFCDILNLDGQPFEGCPRHVLRRSLARAKSAGFECYVAPEIEYFYFHQGDAKAPSAKVEPLDKGSYFELTVGDLGTRIRQQTVMTLEDMGIPVEYAQHEDAPGQHEIDLRHTDALTMADNVMTARLVMKEVAQRNGILASFMPKPMPGYQGSGMHTHISLFKQDANVFADPTDPVGLSATGRAFVAGLLRHGAEIAAVTNQWVNSYKRLVPGYEAPVNVSWARNNRSALVRVPVPKENRAEARRIEYRAPDSACNPYLTFALLLAAGIEGVLKGYELKVPEAMGDLYKLAPEELEKAGMQPLPASLHEAVELMEHSELAHETLGDHVFHWFIRNKRREWDAYATEVSQFELDRYLLQL